ncbi:FMN-dependent NADH-azoreductase [Pseudoalteromonas citrea]|uniref:FMN dependent NADH:quinone oxidoreductase n=2 Tax=Pseudoalteromonas citrea TaxID=43655 RepID=A0AAD4AFR3_9GAMM|nr:NAD(P)H-dependent oxidoreductase [Pseudoalteromonas citrea]KAF7765067.1 FMN-dependent NADH-azoreductase [Pseudoalteromonas citrea]
MTCILKIDSSVRAYTSDTAKHQSVSRKLAHDFTTKYLERNPDSIIINRDLSLTPPPFIDQQWVAASFAKKDNTEVDRRSLKVSDTLIAEVIKADIIVMSAPMYNYGMPAVLKAWFDQVIRVNKTFSFDASLGDNALQPLLSGKTMVLLTSCGEHSFSAGQARAHMNHLGPHIKMLSRYLGVEDFYEVGSEYQEFTDERHTNSVQGAQQKIASLVAKL